MKKHKFFRKHLWSSKYERRMKCVLNSIYKKIQIENIVFFPIKCFTFSILIKGNMSENIFWMIFYVANKIIYVNDFYIQFLFAIDSNCLYNIVHCCSAYVMGSFSSQWRKRWIEWELKYAKVWCNLTILIEFSEERLQRGYTRIP